MYKLGYFCFENVVEVDVFVGIGQPLLSPDYVCNFHFPIVDYVSQVESWPSVAADYYEVIHWF